MSIDTEKDAPLEVISRLARAAIDAVLGEGAVKGVFNDPRDLKELKIEQLPALSIYRQAERRVYETEYSTHVIVVAFEYTMPQTDAAKRMARWPALSIVWNAIADAVVAGKHENLADADGAPIELMHEAGCDAVDATPAVNYGFADHSGVSNPHFIGTIVVHHTPETVDWSTLNDFLRMHTGYWQPSTDAEDKTEADPEGERLAVTTHTFPAASDED